MPLSPLLDSLTAWALDNLPVVVGGVVAVVVLTVCFIRHRRGRPAAATGPPNPLAAESALSWAPPEQSYADRRGAVRREGGPIRVTLASAAFRNGMGDGVVLDRSTGGLRIALSAALAPGSSVQVRATHAPDTVGFVTVIVRSCRKNGDVFEVGCEFEKTPPWNVLLLFG
jgi:hypothetical protein